MQNKCEKCKEGYRLQNGECVACDESLHHCKSCSSPNTCDECEYQIAMLGNDGKCSVCREENNWTKDYNTGRCKCDHFVNLLDDNKCQKCEELIPGCKKCEQTDSPGDALAVEIGYSSSLSPRMGKYLMCTECGDELITDPQSG